MNHIKNIKIKFKDEILEYKTVEYWIKDNFLMINLNLHNDGILYFNINKIDYFKVTSYSEEE